MQETRGGLARFGLQAAALLLFCAGFFEFRPRSPAAPGAAAGECLQAYAAPYDRLVFVVVDALRSDFVYGPGSGFAFLRRMLEEQPEHALGLVARAKAPTVTMPRLKALTAGSPPIFLDLLLNFDEGGLASKAGPAECGRAGFTQDTWVKGFKDAGRRVVMYGDDTWLRLFPHCFDDAHGVSSFFVQDYTHVDAQVTARAVPKAALPDWDAMILHYLGIDHIGHIDGAFSALMRPKQAELDAVLAGLYATLQASDAAAGRATLIVVLGDHGMADNGNHGGSSEPEVSTAAVVLSPSRRLQPAAGRPVVQQVDLVPTLAGLFGLPVPAASTGRFIPELVPAGTPPAVANQMLFKTACQLQQLLGRPVTRCALDAPDCGRALAAAAAAAAAEAEALAGERSLPLMCLGLALTGLCVALAAALGRPPGWRAAAGVAAYVLLQTSSSFIEEEHEFWYFALASLLLARLFGAAGASGTGKRATAALLVLARAPRYWNAVGYQRAQAADARAWVAPDSPAARLLVAGTLLLGLGMYAPAVRRAPLALAYAAVAGLVYAFKFHAGSSAVPVARLCYAACLGLAAAHMAAARGSRLRSLRPVLLLLFVFLLKGHNAPVLGVLVLLGDGLEDLGLGDALPDDALRLAFLHYSYFALGPSNLLVSLDFSNAYTGLTRFNLGLVAAITFAMTWAGPLLAALLLVARPPRAARCPVSDLGLWRSAVALGLLANLVLQRNHLFIWSVFAPRLLFEFGWTIFYGLLLLAMAAAATRRINSPL